MSEPQRMKLVTRTLSRSESRAPRFVAYSSATDREGDVDIGASSVPCSVRDSASTRITLFVWGRVKV